MELMTNDDNDNDDNDNDDNDLVNIHKCSNKD